MSARYEGQVREEGWRMLCDLNLKRRQGLEGGPEKQPMLSRCPPTHLCRPAGRPWLGVRAPGIYPSVLHPMSPRPQLS